MLGLASNRRGSSLPLEMSPDGLSVVKEAVMRSPAKVMAYTYGANSQAACLLLKIGHANFLYTDSTLRADVMPPADDVGMQKQEQVVHTLTPTCSTEFSGGLGVSSVGASRVLSLNLKEVPGLTRPTKFEDRKS